MTTKTTKTATFVLYHVWGTRGQFMLRLAYRGYCVAEKPDQGQATLRELWSVAQAQGFTHALYEDDRGRRARMPLNRFYNRYCV